MTATLQFRRGTVAAHSTFVGSVAEPTVSTGDMRLRIHDSVTAGGKLIANSTELATQASTGNVGISRYASTTEAVAAASTATAVTPAGMGQHSAPLVGNKNLTGGFTATSFSISSSTSITPSGLNGQLQYMTNSVNTTIQVPASDTAVDIWVTNSTAPGTIAFSTGFLVGSTSVIGALSTGASANGLISIRRINGKSTYVLHNISTF